MKRMSHAPSVGTHQTQEDVMRRGRLFNIRFSLKSVFVLTLGIAIGYGLNLRTLQLLTGPASEARMGSLPAYRIAPPDVIDITATGKFSETFPTISGQHLVGPDGMINLGAFGQLSVSGMTINEAQEAVKEIVARQIETPQIIVDVATYNSKFYYVVMQGAGMGDNVLRIPITGNETVLDAIAMIGGLAAPASTQVWISRPRLTGLGSGKKLPIHWDEIVSGSSTTTNYQLLPGDRVFVCRKTSSTANN
jgi:protein involved in polysaccharide export with SLBB domain